MILYIFSCSNEPTSEQNLEPLPTQNLLNSPESVVYDTKKERYIVSNWGDGAIVQIDRDGNQSYFSEEFIDEYSLAGLFIYGDTLLVAAGDAPNAGIIGLSLENGDKLFQIVIYDIGLPNDIIVTDEGIIFVTDYWSDKLYKIENYVPRIVIDQGVGLEYPNGMLYDKNNNRLLILSVMGEGAPVLAVSLDDYSITELIRTGLEGLDGITSDNNGNIYISEWGTDTIQRIPSDFNVQPEVFSDGYSDPADIYFDVINNLIVVPNFASDTIEFISN